MEIAEVGLTVTASGAIRQLRMFAGAANEATTAGTLTEAMGRQLTRTLNGLGLAFGVRQIIEYADGWKNLHARLGLVTRSEYELIVVQQKVLDIANETRSSLDATATLYFRTARNAEQLGRSQNEMLRFTELLNKSLLLSGATTQEASQGMIQLSQSLASGRLQGDEFRTVMESMPAVAKAIAQGMHVTIGELYDLRTAGKITNQEIISSVLALGTKTDEEFKKLPITVGQSLTILKNQLQAYIGGADAASGASASLADAIRALANHISLLVRVLQALAIAYTARWLNAHITAIQKEIAARIAERRAMEASLQARVVEQGEILKSVQAEEASAAAHLRFAQMRLKSAQMTASSAMAAAEAEVAAAEVVAGTFARRAALQEADAVLVEKRLQRAVAAGAEERIIAELTVKAELERSIAIEGATRAELASTAATEARIAMDRVAIASSEQLAVLENAVASAELRHAITARGAAAASAELATAEAAASVSTGLLARTMAGAAVVARGFWTAIGGPIGAILLGLWALYEVWNKFFRKKPDQDALEKAMAGLNDKIGTAATLTDELTRKERARLKAIGDIREANAEMVRAAQQELALSDRQGMAQEELRIQYDAINKIQKARLAIHDKVLQQTITEADGNQLLAESVRAIRTEEDLRLRALRASQLLSATNDREDTLRQTRQEIELSRTYGIAQEELRIHYDAVNKEIQKRRELTGDALQVALDSIHADEALQQTTARLMHFSNDVKNIFQDTFERIFDGGIKTFNDLFSSIRSMFLRMVADLASQEVMRRWGTTLSGVLAGIFGGTSPVTAQPGATGTATTAAGTVAGLVSQGGTTTPVPVMLEGITVTARTSLAKMLGSGLAVALATYGVGSVVGGLTANRALGTGGGALAGAGTGALLGSVLPGIGTTIGAAVGAVAGALGGFLGASRKRAEEEARTREVIAKNNQRLFELRQSLEESLMSGRNLAKAGSFSARIASILAPGGIGIGSLGSEDVTKAFSNPGQMDARLRQLTEQYGLNFQQLASIAKQVGIELFDSAGKVVPEAFRQLTEAIGLTVESITRFTGSLEDTKTQQEAYNKLFDIADTPIQQLTDAFSILQKMSPDLLQKFGLNGLDLSSAENRNVLLNGLRDIFTMIQNNGLTPELLGAFTDKNQLLDAILATKDGLDAFRTSLLEVTTDFPRAMDVIYYEQKYGRGLPSSISGSTSATSQNVTGIVVHGNVIVQANSEEDGEVILQKVEKAAVDRASVGGYTFMPNTVIEG